MTRTFGRFALVLTAVLVSAICVARAWAQASVAVQTGDNWGPKVPYVLSVASVGITVWLMSQLAGLGKLLATLTERTETLNERLDRQASYFEKAGGAVTMECCRLTRNGCGIARDSERGALIGPLTQQMQDLAEAVRTVVSEVNDLESRTRTIEHRIDLGHIGIADRGADTGGGRQR